MVHDYFEKYAFLCDMYDEDSDTVLSLLLNFFPFDNSIQVINTSKGNVLLRRVQIPTLSVEMLQIGNIVNVYSKLLLITDCLPATKRVLFHKVESTFAMIKPIPSSEHGKVITFIMQHGFRIVRMKNGRVPKEFAMKLYGHISGNSMMPIIIDYITSGEVIGLELVASNAVAKWRSCLGATDPQDAAPGTLRRTYGENKLRNIAHGCNTVEDATEALDSFFGYEKGLPKVPFRATLKNCTCCVIKPHAVLEGSMGAILEQISTNGKFIVSAMAMFSVSVINAMEFYEVYKGVLPEYEGMCQHLAEGKCVVLEVKPVDEKINVVCEFRKICGPRDPDLCRQLYPDSIRAKYGKTILHNAVHCTDLPEDGENEVEYFFKLLSTDS